MAKTTVVNRIDTTYIDTENPTVSVNTTALFFSFPFFSLLSAVFPAF